MGVNPESARRRTGSRFGRELREWGKAFVVVAPILVLEWLFLRAVQWPWNVLLLTLPFFLGLVGLGVFSKSNVWTFLVWLGPFAALETAWLAGFHNPLVALGLVLALVWIGGIMFSERFGKAAFSWVGGAHAWLSAIGLPAAKRKAYGELRRAMRVTSEQRRDQLQGNDLPRKVRAFREYAQRVEAQVPPDERWAAACEAIARPSTVYADMLEGKQAIDYDELKALADRGRQLSDELLRDESPTYRFLTYVPFG